MNNDDKTVNQNTSVPSQPAQVPPDDGVVSPVGSPNKEISPAGINTPQSGELNPAGAEVKHNIGQELKEMGIEEKVDRPDLTKEHEKAGVRHAGPSIPAPTRLSSSSYPMSEDEVSSKLKTGSGDDSGTWLAVLIKKVMTALGFEI
ncbi:MAG: hypothetical protein HY424_02485 [Candidatus Levybacteria bacterium]|nr:hypothetical protein [Candidatus Levybacteria bacterium]